MQKNDTSQPWSNLYVHYFDVQIAFTYRDRDERNGDRDRRQTQIVAKKRTLANNLAFTSPSIIDQNVIWHHVH